MCTTCGCGVGEARVAAQALSEPAGLAHDGSAPPPTAAEEAADHGHSPINPGLHSGGRALADDLGDGLWHVPDHAHPHKHPHNNPHDHGDEPADQRHADHSHRAHPPAPVMTPSRLVQIERDILARNDADAAENRQRFAEQGIFALNLVSSPGSGKTTLLCRTIELLKARLPIAVIEGDQQTSRDTERIRETGVPALQINTGKGCHLDAQIVGQALHRLSPVDDSLLLIENVGNLVCPAAFDLGEAHKVVILSVTEGEDKPLKYPHIFHAATLMLLNKVDLLPYLSYNAELAIRYARQVNPALQVIPVSATTGEGFGEWLAWLSAGCAARQATRKETVAALRRRVAELEALLSAGSRG
jgi:hydrogenase nickel incorporation protein HypB